MSRPYALVTNCLGFAGPAAVQALLEAGFTVLAHDREFENSKTWNSFQAGRDHLVPLSGSDPARILTQALGHTDHLGVIVSNDHVPAPALAPETAPLSALADNLDGLVTAPFALVQAAIPHLKAIGGGNVVMITSNRMNLPLKGGAFPDAARAGANALVKSLAIDLAEHQITVNAIAPNFLYSEAYYPAAFFKETQAGRAYVKASVPGGRLADPEEIGEVITFLATAKTRFLTGSIIEFSGGWPYGPSRPNPDIPN